MNGSAASSADGWSAAERLAAAIERDGPYCVWCSREFTGLVRATREHLVPRVKGGPSVLENELAACSRCNRERGHRSPVQWLDEVAARGREPRPDVLAAGLRRLQRRIDERGGHRRIRDYLRTELRKLERRGSAAHG
ncbi:HNH endonuclease [Egicoccus sp. AB-alg2]|uniref:HNH endonuclease n=1 Tax=Egicoccus sp. AB-alg2 TaxID=3242693 RepID=UPI00359E84D5